MIGTGYQCDRCGTRVVLQSSGNRYIDYLPDGWVRVVGYADPSTVHDYCSLACAQVAIIDAMASPGATS